MRRITGLVFLVSLAAGCTNPSAEFTDTFATANIAQQSAPHPAGQGTPTAMPTEDESDGDTSAIVFPKIDRSPEAQLGIRQTPDSEPVYDPMSIYTMGLDLMNQDLSGLDLRNSLENMRMAAFDKRTTWPSPENLPPGFDPQQIMEQGKKPGPGVRSLHAQGITGQGVGIAFIGEPILVDHTEFADRLRLYEEAEDVGRTPAHIWSMMSVSAAAGKTTGVAPGVDLYYMATWWGKLDPSGVYMGDLTYATSAIRRLLAINEQLPPDHKIRVIVLHTGIKFGNFNMGKCEAALEEARAAGMLVIEAYGTGGDGRPLLGVSEGLVLEGLGRDPLADPEVFESYTFWESLTRYQYGPERYFGEDQLFFPNDSRTLAGDSGVDAYTFARQGGNFSSSLAGAYALAAQVDPGITPARFFELAKQTGRSWQATYNGTAYTLGPVLDLPALIAALKNP